MTNDPDNTIAALYDHGTTTRRNRVAHAGEWAVIAGLVVIVLIAIWSILR